MSKNPFSISCADGVPRLVKNGIPIAPIAFYQSPFESAELKNAQLANFEIFTGGGGIDYRKHPYWVGENQYDFSRYDQSMEEFFRNCPKGYLIPRIFVAAPEWWLEKHPEELVGFPGMPPRTTGYGGGTTFHESFASERWKREQGEAFRQLIRHLKSMPWGDRIIGVHIAGGPCGEWHAWYDAKTEVDCGPAMAARYGKPVPPLEQRPPEYWESFYSATIDAIARFATILKEESDCLSLVFYGYFNPGVTMVSTQHRALDKLLALDCVDMVASPHDYTRRRAGEDAFFRAYPASYARHGKLFFDEADDRTPLGKIPYACSGRIMADTPHDAIQFLRREFGNALTHCAGLWFMDIDHGMFRATDYWVEMARAKYYGDRAMRLPWRRVSEIAVLCDNSGRCQLPPEQFLDQGDTHAFLAGQFPQFTHLGAPFDLYSTCDISAETLSKYRMIVLLDGIALPEEACEALKALQKDGRSFVWFYGAGAFDPARKAYSAERMSGLTGIRFTRTEDQELPRLSVFQDSNFWFSGRYSPGFSPIEAMADFGDWSSWYFGRPNASAETLRRIARRAGVFLYSETDDVLSASESALMLHASASGNKVLHLPGPKTVTDMITNEVLGRHITEFSFTLERGETALFELS